MTSYFALGDTSVGLRPNWRRRNMDYGTAARHDPHASLRTRAALFGESRKLVHA